MTTVTDVQQRAPDAEVDVEAERTDRDQSTGAPSRRQLLAAGAGLVAGALALDLAKGPDPVSLLESGTVAVLPAGALSVVVLLEAVDVQRTVLGAERPQPERGDTVLTTGTLMLDGDEVGEFTFSDLHLSRPGRNQQGRSSSTGQHVLHLDDGTIVGAGAATPDDEPDQYAVVGGTGRYLGASGAYTIQFHPTERRVDGAVTILLDLQIPEARHGG